MTGWLPTLIVCVTLVWFGERFGPLLRHRYGPKPDVLEDPMPVDLASVVASYGAEWAQEDAARAMRELYQLTGSWDAVRQKFNMGS